MRVWCKCWWGTSYTKKWCEYLLKFSFDEGLVYISRGTIQNKSKCLEGITKKRMQSCIPGKGGVSMPPPSSWTILGHMPSTCWNTSCFFSNHWLIGSCYIQYSGEIIICSLWFYLRCINDRDSISTKNPEKKHMTPKVNFGGENIMEWVCFSALNGEMYPYILDKDLTLSTRMIERKQGWTV